MGMIHTLHLVDSQRFHEVSELLPRNPKATRSDFVAAFKRLRNPAPPTLAAEFDGKTSIDQDLRHRIFCELVTLKKIEFASAFTGDLGKVIVNVPELIKVNRITVQPAPKYDFTPPAEFAIAESGIHGFWKHETVTECLKEAARFASPRSVEHYLSKSKFGLVDIITGKAGRIRGSVSLLSDERCWAYWKRLIKGMDECVQHKNLIGFSNF